MQDIQFKVLSNIASTDNIYIMTLEGLSTLPEFLPGQFINLSVPGNELILRRPFCIYSGKDNCITIIYAVVGKGTVNMTKLKCGDSVSALMPLGNGFSLSVYKKIAAVGGGIGAAPLLEGLRRNTAGENTAYLGFCNGKDADVLLKDFESVSKVRLTTDDGSMGEKCFPTELLKKDFESGLIPDVIITCGPDVMMNTVKTLSQKYNIPAFMTGESRMGCGYGACLVCACKVAGEHKRACYDGPVFNLSEVEF